jgi:hypothetical protein
LDLPAEDDARFSTVSVVAFLVGMVGLLRKL